MADKADAAELSDGREGMMGAANVPRRAVLQFRQAGPIDE
jgi:hypothetical protein